MDATAEKWNEMGVHLANDCGKYEEAIKSFDEALNLDSSFFAAWHNKGNALNKLGDHDGAKKCWDEARELEPGFCTEHQGLYVSNPKAGIGCYSLPGPSPIARCD
ncbi:MAG: tetratricopeptide repeat protein [Methanotrichaceae archaeon]|nr:tetratricopeptide repeat protein [Methanotrichaceae archaeon]